MSTDPKPKEYKLTLHEDDPPPSLLAELQFGKPSVRRPTIPFTIQGSSPLKTVTFGVEPGSLTSVTEALAFSKGKNKVGDIVASLLRGDSSSGGGGASTFFGGATSFSFVGSGFKPTAASKPSQIVKAPVPTALMCVGNIVGKARGGRLITHYGAEVEGECSPVTLPEIPPHAYVLRFPKSEGAAQKRERQYMPVVKAKVLFVRGDGFDARKTILSLFPTVGITGFTIVLNEEGYNWKVTNKLSCPKEFFLGWTSPSPFYLVELRGLSPVSTALALWKEKCVVAPTVAADVDKRSVMMRTRVETPRARKLASVSDLIREVLEDTQAKGLGAEIQASGVPRENWVPLAMLQTDNQSIRGLLSHNGSKGMALLGAVLYYALGDLSEEEATRLLTPLVRSYYWGARCLNEGVDPSSKFQYTTAKMTGDVEEEVSKAWFWATHANFGDPIRVLSIEVLKWFAAHCVGVRTVNMYNLSTTCDRAIKMSHILKGGWQ